MSINEKIQEELNKVYEELISSPGLRVDKENLSYKISGYWCGNNVLRLDIKLKHKEGK